MVQMILARRTDGWVELEDTSAGAASNLLRSKFSLRPSTLRAEIRESSTSPVTTAVCHGPARHRNQFLPQSRPRKDHGIEFCSHKNGERDHVHPHQQRDGDAERFVYDAVVC